MKSRILIGGVVLGILALSMAACQSVPAGTGALQGFVPAFEVTGDVEQPFLLDSLEDFPDSGLEREGRKG